MSTCSERSRMAGRLDRHSVARPANQCGEVMSSCNVARLAAVDRESAPAVVIPALISTGWSIIRIAEFNTWRFATPNDSL
ncbi:MAG: hypothetical protein HRT86_18080 [Ilumatobacteraceae bacterium]|nr:hypothetical protein [Ilumatobacteraceae bacterium]